jgi:hypothetical protein
MDIIKDEREWMIRVELKNSLCPYLYYPANYFGCELSKNREGECRLELCPLIQKLEE